MDMLTVEQMARKWDVSTRTIQNLCKSGRIPGAVNFGKSWMIPADAVRPADRRRKSNHQENENNLHALVRKCPFLDMTNLYSEPGTADQCIENLSMYPESQKLFAAEIAYSRGQIDKVYEYANDFLENHSGLYAVISGGMLLSLCAMWKGDVDMWYKAKRHLLEAPCKNEIERSIIELSVASADSAIRKTDEFPDWFVRGCFDNLPRDSHPAARVYYIKHLLFLAQEIAFDNIQWNGMQGLSMMKVLPYIIEPMISQMVVDKIIMAEIYLRILCAIAYRQSGDDIHGGQHLDKAIMLCLADGLYGPLVEYRHQLGMFLDQHIAAVDPLASKKVKELHKEQLHSGWTILHNAVLERTVSTSLSIREREVARLASFGMTDAQIARQLNISESSVKVMIRSAKNKTHVSKRIDLGLYI